jgi:hypothetical protein
MTVMEPLILFGIILALALNFVNGLNDASHSIATVVATNTSMIEAPMATTMDRGVRPLLVTIAVPIVAATAVVKRNGPAMLQTAVKNTAFMGDRAFVATTVAIEWEASLRPLTKFRARARIIPNRMRGSMTVMNGPSRCH